MELRKSAETEKTLTLEWTPPAGVQVYAFFAAGQRVSTGTANLKDGTPRSSVRFSKGAEPYEVAALCRDESGFRVEVGVYETAPPPPPPPPPPPSASAGIGWFSWGSPILPPSHVADYDLISTGPTSYSAGSSPAKRVFVYKSMVSCSVNGEAYGLSAAQARSVGGILLSTSGAEMVNARYAENRIGDPGLPAYQEAWCENVWAQIQGKGIDGLFIDDTLRTYVALSGGVLSQKYPKPAPPALSTWESAVRSFAQAAHAFFSARGVQLVFNANGYVPGYTPSNTGQSDREFWDRLLPYADGFCTEYLHHNPTYPQADKLQRSNASNQGWGYWWENWQLLPAKAEALGIMHWCLARGPAAAVDYNLCSQLLETKRGVAMWIPNGTPGEAWHATYDKALALGSPLGAKTKNGNRWERRFAGGLVWVDPVAGTAGIG